MRIHRVRRRNLGRGCCSRAQGSAQLAASPLKNYCRFSTACRRLDLPADTFGTRARGGGHEADQIDHVLAVEGLLRQGCEALIAITEDDDLGVIDYRIEVTVEQRGDMRNLRFDVVLVGAIDAGIFDVAVVDAQFEALADQHLGQLHQRALAQVVGAGLEAQAEQGDLALVVAGDDVEGVLHLDHVAAHQRTDQRRFDVQAAGAVGQGAHVFRQAGTTEGEAGLHVVLGQVELVILADHVHHFAAVDPDRLGDVADLVGEGHLGGVPDVAGVLDHLGDIDVLADDRCVEFAVDAFQQVTGGGIQFADHGHRREIVVLDRGAFAEELGVHRYAEIDTGFLARAVFEDRDHHVLHGARQHGAAHDHGMPFGLVAHGKADFAAHAFDVVQFQVAVLFARRTDANKRDLGVTNRVGDIGGAAQVTRVQALLQQHFQAGFDYWRFAIVDQVDFSGGYIDTDHVMAAGR